MAENFFLGPCDKVERSLCRGNYVLRMDDIIYLLNGVQTDPRTLFAPGFQLLPPGTAPFGGSWASGEWETSAPTGGPYACFVEAGLNQNAAVNPGAVGRYRLWVQMVGCLSIPSFRSTSSSSRLPKPATEGLPETGTNSRQYGNMQATTGPCSSGAALLATRTYKHERTPNGSRSISPGT